MSQWNWFYDLVDHRLGPVFSQHHFTKLTGKGYEEDENKERAAFIFYASTTGTRALVDIHARFGIQESDFYVVRVYVGKEILKEWLYPIIRAETGDTDLWHGWKCPTEDDVKNSFDEIKAGLQKYLTEHKLGDTI